VFVAGGSSAQASLVARWDFSQYAGDGFMSIDGGSSFTNTLSANYSDLDPTFGAGFESAAFGTMYVDGSFGSTPVAAVSGSEQFLPTAAYGGSLARIWTRRHWWTSMRSAFWRPRGRSRPSRSR
jgi:hypothetical protein